MDFISILKILKIIFSAIPWLLSVTALFQFLYNKYPKFYFFFVKRFKKWRDTKWKLTVSVSVQRDLDFFRILEEVINDVFGKRQRVFNLKNKKQYEFSDYTLTVQYNLDCSNEEYVTVELLFGTITATKSTAIDKLKNLRKLFNKLNSRIDFRDESYSMNIYFITMKNPFYGLMIQRLGPEHIQYFQCNFSIDQLERKMFKKRTQQTETNQELTVFKDYISINHHNYDTIEDITKKCLLLEG
ncbi:hypothetical protein [Bacillus sp. SIMBA_005]|uniref:hypothetical protein n=1 Tax=Bacillus sp. SIMBA_005 TaxID=3085754 RepID=UPI00397B0E82